MSLNDILAKHDQGHLLDFLTDISPEEQETLRAQLEDIDFEQVSRLVRGSEQAVDWSDLASRAEPPAAAVRLDRQYPDITAEQAWKAGEKALREGKVGMILVAGGQGTRLGFEKPKGMFPIGPISNRTLFQMHCDRLKGVMRRYGVSIPLYVMTSPATDALTRGYFAETERCGLSEDELVVFCQGSMPAVDDQTGKILLSEKGRVALSPDGHGGLVAALSKNGCLADAASRGIEYFFYAQVDNPLAELCDPELVGYHILSASQMTTQVVHKRFPMEKVGNLVDVDGKTMIIEYSDLPESAAEQRNPDGSLKLWAGSIAIHVFDRDFLEAVVNDAEGLPFHRAHKPVAYINEQGEKVTPDAPNAIKFERFVFDLLPFAKQTFVVEGDPAKVFAPVKNADGAQVDTPTIAKESLVELHRRWIEEAGSTVADGVRVEIHPEWALDAEEVKRRLGEPTQFDVDTFLQ